MKNKKYLILFIVPFLIWALLFEIIPLISIVLGSFKDDAGTFTLVQYKTLFNKFYYQSIINSIKISLISSFVGIIISIIGSYSISRLRPQLRDKFIILSNLTSNFSGVPLAFAFVVLLGNNGVVSIFAKHYNINFLSHFNVYTIVGLTLVYIYFQLPLGILLMYPVYDSIKKEWKEASYILGASKIKFWRFIGIPVILPGILNTFSVLFANSMGAYATAVALTTGNINLLSVRIGSLVSGDINYNPNLASALSLILAVIILAVSLIFNSISKRRGGANNE